MILKCFTMLLCPRCGFAGCSWALQFPSLPPAAVGQLLDVVHHAVPVPLRVDLLPSAPVRPRQPFVVPDVAKHRLHRADAPACPAVQFNYEKGDATSTGAREARDFKTSANQPCIGNAMGGPLTARLCAAEKRRESGSGHLWPKSVLSEGRTRPEFTDLPRFPSIAG